MMRLLIFFFAGLLATVAPAQDPPGQIGGSFGGFGAEVDGYPVKVTSAEAGAVQADGRFPLTVRVTILGDYHIYGFDNAVAPTRFKVEGTELVTVVGDAEASRAPELHADEFDTYTYWEGEIGFTVPLRLAEGEQGQEVPFTLVVEQTACNADGCLPPEPVSFKTQVTPTVDVAAEPGATEPATGPVGEDEKTPRALAKLTGEATPGRDVELWIPWGEGADAVGEVIPSDAFRFSVDHLEVAGTGRVESSGDGTGIRVPVKVKDQLTDGALIELDGLVQLESGVVHFAVKGAVSQSITAFVLLAAVAALLALLTPCVFPMIPITVSFFTKQAESARYPPVTMGVIYCLGIVGSFTAIGVLFTLALGPEGATAFAQSRITLGCIAALFIIFALSLFGMFELQLPQSVMGLAGRAQGAGGLMGVLLLGLLFAVTSFTCTAPFVGTILAGAAASGEWTRPVLGMIVFSGVLAAPFFFLSIFPSRLQSMPRAGGWLNEVKVVMGFIEVAAAFKFLGDMEPTIFTRFLILCVWTVTFGVCGVYLLGLFRLPHDAPKERLGVLGMVAALFFLSFALYCTKGLNGEPLSKDIDAYLPAEVKDRTPIGRRRELAKELQTTGLVIGANSGSQLQGRVGYDRAFVYWDKDKGRVVDEDPYEDALAEAKRLGTALFIDFTGYA